MKGERNLNLEEKTVSKHYIYNGKIINLRVDDALLPNGNAAKREVVEHPGGVGVLALDSDKNVFLVRQFRYPYSETVLEIPAGKKEHGEDPLVCGKRELKEETGLTAKNYISLGKIYPTPGYTNEVIDIFLATDLSYGEKCPDEDEFLNVEKLPFNELLKLVEENKISDSKTQIAVLKTARVLRI